MLFTDIPRNFPRNFSWVGDFPALPEPRGALQEESEVPVPEQSRGSKPRSSAVGQTMAFLVIPLAN